jgi:PhnB protein
MKIPANHQALMPYLILHNAEGFIDFTSAVFGATLNFKRMRDTENVIMHAEVNINGCTVMFAGGTAEWEPMPGSLFVYVEDADKSYQLAIDNGAETIMELSTRDYGRTCGVKDPFGNIWWITSVS